uniref:Uncharacterized protein n=1 Tax=Arundo donax TaxID=35708 RepID=A0A0A9GIV9_ARUDO
MELPAAQIELAIADLELPAGAPLQFWWPFTRAQHGRWQCGSRPQQPRRRQLTPGDREVAARHEKKKRDESRWRRRREEEPDIRRFFSVASVGGFYFPVVTAQTGRNFHRLTDHPNNIF